MKKIILSKFNALKTWQKVLVVITCVVLLPLAIVGVIALLTRGTGDDITETLVKQKKDDIKTRTEEADKKDKLLAAKGMIFDVERKALHKTLEENGGAHAEISKRIDNAKSIDELRAIAHQIRGNRP